MRNLQIIKNGGWHFSYLQTPENISKKLNLLLMVNLIIQALQMKKISNSKISKGQYILIEVTI